MRIPLVLPAAIILAWCFVVGACVGSFLNVVAWRLPLGMSLLWPGSHCPACGRAILLRDNVPIFGWLWLRGRCRACGIAISPRYPLVEFISAAAMCALAYPELVASGANLPDYALDVAAHGSLEALLRVWIYHSVMAALLITTALFEWDRAQVPQRFIALAFAAGIVPALLWPDVQPVPFAPGHAALEPDALDRFGTGVLGLLAGIGLGLSLAWASLAGRTRAMSGQSVVALASVGAFLGWQAAVTSAFMAAGVVIVMKVASLLTRRELSLPALAIAVAALVQVLAWRPLDTLAERFLPPAAVILPLVAWSGVLALVLMLAVLGNKRDHRPIVPPA